MLMPNAPLGPALNARAVISSLPVTDAVIETAWLGATAVIVTRKSMYPAPLIVFDADAFAERPEAPPKFNDAVTVSAFADAAGLFNETRTTNVVPATYVLLPVRYVGAPVIVNAACALIAMTTSLVIGPNNRPEISSPVPARRRDRIAGGSPHPRRSPASRCIHVPLMFLDAAFAEMPSHRRRLTGAQSAFADAAGLTTISHQNDACHVRPLRSTPRNCRSPTPLVP
jgi:hypothetical protein